MVSVENYRIIEDVQHFIPYDWTNAMNALIDAILEKEADEKNDELIRLISEGYIISDHGHLSANFAVFPEALFFGKLKMLLAPTIETARETMKEVCLFAGDSLATYMPEHLKETAKQIAYIKYQMDTKTYQRLYSNFNVKTHVLNCGATKLHRTIYLTVSFSRIESIDCLWYNSFVA